MAKKKAYGPYDMPPPDSRNAEQKAAMAIQKGAMVPPVPKPPVLSMSKPTPPPKIKAQKIPTPKKLALPKKIK